MRTRNLLITLVAASMALTACGGDDEAIEPVDSDTFLPVEEDETIADEEPVEDEPTEPLTEDESPAATASPEATASPTPTAAASPEFVTAQEDFILAPQEPVEVAPGERREFSVIGEEVPSQLDLALLPCENVTFESGGVSILVQNGEAVGLGETDAGAATIVSVNGEGIEPSTLVSDVEASDEDPAVAFEVSADSADCAIPVAFEDTDDDDELDVRDERFNAGKVTFAA